MSFKNSFFTHSKPESPSNNMPQIIAHRGLRSSYPENTSAAISAALSLPGIHGVEFDVELTLDGSLAVLHQETMLLNAARNALALARRDVTSRDWVREMSLRELQQVDAGSWFNPRFSSQRIPSLDQILALDWGAATAFIELKDPTFWGSRDARRPKELASALKRSLRAERPRINIISFNPLVLAEIRVLLPSLPTILALWEEWKQDPRGAVDLALLHGASAISVPEDFVLTNPQWRSSTRALGLQLITYPVSPAHDEPAFKSWNAATHRPTFQALCDLGVDAVTSDFPEKEIQRAE